MSIPGNPIPAPPWFREAADAHSPPWCDRSSFAALAARVSEAEGGILLETGPRLYFLSEPGEEIVPSKGIGAGADCVIASNCPPAMHVPVAPLNRPVPSTTSNVSTLSKRPDV